MVFKKPENPNVPDVCAKVGCDRPANTQVKPSPSVSVDFTRLCLKHQIEARHEMTKTMKQPMRTTATAINKNKIYGSSFKRDGVEPTRKRKRRSSDQENGCGKDDRIFDEEEPKIVPNASATPIPRRSLEERGKAFQALASAERKKSSEANQVHSPKPVTPHTPSKFTHSPSIKSVSFNEN